MNDPARKRKRGAVWIRNPAYRSAVERLEAGLAANPNTEISYEDRIETLMYHIFGEIIRDDWWERVRQAERILATLDTPEAQAAREEKERHDKQFKKLPSAARTSGSHCRLPIEQMDDEDEDENEDE